MSSLEIKQDDSLKIIPVVVFTTSANPKDIETCYRNGANSYMVKPIDLDKLRKTVRLLIDYWVEAVILPHEVKR